MTFFDEAGEPIEITFSELDDFHPDRLYRDLPLFQGLRELRSRLLKPDTFEAAARELRLAAQQRHLLQGDSAASQGVCRHRPARR